MVEVMIRVSILVILVVLVGKTTILLTLKARKDLLRS